MDNTTCNKTTKVNNWGVARAFLNVYVCAHL